MKMKFIYSTFFGARDLIWSAKSILVMTFVLGTLSSPALGGTVGPSVGTGSTAGGTTGSSATSGTGTSTSTTTNPAAVDLNANVSGSGASSNADSASGSQMAGAALNAGLGGAMLAAGPPLLEDPFTTALGAFMIAQGVMGIAQSMAQSDSAGGNKLAANNFKTYGNASSSGGDGTSGGSSNGSSSGGSSGDNSLNLPPGTDLQIKKLEDLGYKLDLKNGSFTTPNGRSFSAAKGTSPSSIESQLGLPPGTAEKGSELVNEIAKHHGVGVSGGAMADGGSGANSSGADGYAGSSGEGYDGSDGRNSGTDKSGGRSVASTGQVPASSLVAGLSANYKGERIGVASDDLFSMVSRRYQLKHTQDVFITPDRPAQGVLAQPRK